MLESLITTMVRGTKAAIFKQGSKKGNVDKIHKGAH